MAASAVSAASAAPASALNVKATSATTPQVWMKIHLINHDESDQAVGHIYFDKGSNQITYMLEKNENWSAEWLAMYEDQHITVHLDRPADLVTYSDVARSIIRQSVHFNYTIDPEDFTYGVSFDMLFRMTFAQYHAIKQNPELARFITMIDDEMSNALHGVNMKYRNLKAKSKEKQQQLTNEIAIAKQRIAELKNTVSELESAVKKRKEKRVAKAWMYKGNQYYRDGDNNLWRKTNDGCEFVGVYIEEEDRIDEDVGEPYYESEDDDE